MAFLGQATVSVTDGSINVFGKNMRRGDVPHRIVSSPCNSLLLLVNPSESEVAQVCLSSIHDGLEDMRLGNGSSVLGLVDFFELLYIYSCFDERPKEIRRLSSSTRLGITITW